jgi:hypothetical protein
MYESTYKKRWLICYKNFIPVISSLPAFSNYYPDSDIFMISNNGLDYSKLAKKFILLQTRIPKNRVIK